MRVMFETFKSSIKSWEALFQEASDFATKLPDGHLICISHSADNSTGVVAVWYWGEPKTCPKCEYDLTGNRSGKCPECGTPV